MTTALVIRTGTIYRLTSPSGKAYIGQTRTSLGRRLRQHGSPSSNCPAIAAALRRHGSSFFSAEALMQGVPSPLLDLTERLCIWLFGTVAPSGYNLDSGGSGSFSRGPLTRAHISKSSIERRSLASEQSKALWTTPGFREKQRAARLASWADPFARCRRMARIAKATSRPEVLAKLSKSLSAALSTDDQRKRLRDRWDNPSYRNRTVSAQRAGWENPEARARARAAAKARWEAPGYRERQRASHTKKEAA